MAKVRESGVQRWTIAMDMHVEASVAQQCPYVHFQWIFDSMTKGVTLRCRDGLRLKGSLPHKSLVAPQARGRACKPAFDQGHFYLSAGKIGGVRSCHGNFRLKPRRPTTRVGKTHFAKALAGEAATLEVNCAGSVGPDLRSFDPTLHRAIVFDDEASANLVLRHEKLFQGGVEEVSMAASATNMYSYSVWVYGCMLIITCNHWEQDVQALSEEDAEWIRGNGINAYCAQKLYL